ncbi:polysaccharide deacetylase family protein [Paraflavitalea speifideaquila]|uniref:polysaccharide deacetylase family protein n=1 Tax=Paraflavitalea speifideaquila TaxID=3076558 RepID=UPI0028F03121|nr:polysaccharide deacetylase family protein [Paraflavitalea speifideiaquila]
MKTIVPYYFARHTAVLAAVVLTFSCQSVPDAKVAIAAPPAATTTTTAPATDPKPTPVTPAKAVRVDAAAVLARKEVPILCYHQIRDWRVTDSKTAQNYIVPTQAFRDQLKMLADNGYHTILPDQLYAYLTTGAALPSKPIMLTFDDTDLDQFTVATPEMNKYGFKGVFFIMTVSLGRPNYMSKAQVKQLSDSGHSIGSHTWDHHNVKQYQGQDWVTQVEKPSKQLEVITGKPISFFFAYPFGLWNPAAIPQLKQRGIMAAFQLSGKRDVNDPLYTIRRIIVPGAWKPATLQSWIQKSF